MESGANCAQPRASVGKRDSRPARSFGRERQMRGRESRPFPVATMKPTPSVVFLAVMLAVTLSGCEDSARRPIQVRPPEVSPARRASASLGRLPLDSRRAHAGWLVTQPPNGVEVLIKEVEAAFQSGEQNYKA